MTDNRIPEIYSDGVGKNRLSGGVVRLDFLSASETFDADPPNMPAVIACRLILSPQAFLKTVDNLNTLLKELVAAGVVSLNPAGEAAGETELAPSKKPKK